MTEITAPHYTTVETALRPVGRARVEAWLWSVAAMVFLMVVLGGATRLTESGLSITEWQPVKGVIPPLTHADWLEAFAKYKLIPQAELYPDMTLGHFQAIFLMEWTHRLVARLIAVVVLAPLVAFAVRGMLTWRLFLQVVGIFVLGGLQGGVGWLMVKSGLLDRVEVAPPLLAAHLLLASITFACVVWIATEQRPAREARAPGTLRGLASLMILVVLAQIGLGALVAGSRAGHVYNTWPLMDGHLILPRDVLGAMSPWWRNLVDNVATVQFQHRVTAYALLALALAQAAWTTWAMPATPAARRAVAVAGLILAQATIGVVTLLLVVPIWAGLLHQSFAMIVLGMAVVHRQRLRGQEGTRSSFSRLREKVAPRSGVG